MVQTRSARKAAKAATSDDDAAPAPTAPAAAKTEAPSPSPAKTKAAPPWTTGRDGLYPTVAISDAFMVGAHLWSARRMRDDGATEAALGFWLVALAAAAGVLRFGYSESSFAAVNGHLAELATFLGLPLVGLHFARLAPYCAARAPESLPFAVFCAAVLSARRSLPDALDELAKVLFNVCCFVGPVAAAALARAEHRRLFGVALFVVAAVPVGADRHACLFGVRRENWFHYLIGLASLLIAGVL